MRITSKGQVTIPHYIREKHALRPNSEVDFKEQGERVYIVRKKSNNKSASRFRKFRGAASVKMTTDEIMNLTRGIVERHLRY